MGQEGPVLKNAIVVDDLVGVGVGYSIAVV
jgi:hypothetical protein